MTIPKYKDIDWYGQLQTSEKFEGTRYTAEDRQRIVGTLHQLHLNQLIYLCAFSSQNEALHKSYHRNGVRLSPAEQLVESFYGPGYSPQDRERILEDINREIQRRISSVTVVVHIAKSDSEYDEQEKSVQMFSEAQTIIRSEIESNPAFCGYEMFLYFGPGEEAYLRNTFDIGKAQCTFEGGWSDPTVAGMVKRNVSPPFNASKITASGGYLTPTKINYNITVPSSGVSRDLMNILTGDAS